MTTENFDESSQLSRRSLLTALFATAIAALAPGDAEAQERQFTTFHHQPRSPRPGRSSRGWRRRRARVRRTGPTQSIAPETPAQ